MIEIKGLTKRFKEADGELTVLKDLSFEISAGDKVAIMGASGSGKTTLLQLIGGLDRATEGEIKINGSSINDLKGRRLAEFRNLFLGYIFQFHHLLPDFTAIENVIIPGMMAKVKDPELTARAMELLKSVGVDHRASHHPGELSGGERQRVALARALFNRPALIIADEPTGNLDRENSSHFLDIVDKLNKENKQTFLIATHDETVADAMDYRLIIEGGTIIKRGAK